MTYQDIQDLQMLLDKDIKGVIAQGDITPKDYQCLDVAIDISKDLCEIAEKLEIMEEKVYGNYDGWSGTNYNNRGGNSGMYYDDNIHGNSFQSNNMRNRGGNRGNRSGHTPAQEKLEMMMQNASSEQERQVIQKLMKEMEGM